MEAVTIRASEADTFQVFVIKIHCSRLDRSVSSSGAAVKQLSRPQVAENHHPLAEVGQLR
jgi:hypothetical protein